MNLKEEILTAILKSQLNVAKTEQFQLNQEIEICKTITGSNTAITLMRALSRTSSMKIGEI